MASTIESTILQRIAEIIEELSWVKKVEYDEIRLQISDIPEQYTPYVQLISGPQLNTHQHRLLVTDWTIGVELVLKKNSQTVVNQVEMLNKKQELEEKIGANAALITIPGVQHIVYRGATPDMHLFDPYYFVALELGVLYNKPYTGSC